MVQKEKRLQVTISNKYPLMQEIVAEFREEDKSISDYLCRLATEDRLSKTSKETKNSKGKEAGKAELKQNRDVGLPSIDMIVD